MPEELSRLGSRVRRLREDGGYTQKALAEKANVSTKRLGELERGVPNARIMTAVKVADALGVPAYTLLAPDHAVPPNADPMLVRRYEMAREAVTNLGQSMGIMSDGPSERTVTESSRYERPKRTRVRTKKSS